MAIRLQLSAWVRAHRAQADLALALALTALAVASLRFGHRHIPLNPDVRPTTWVAYVMASAACLSIAWRQKFPLAVLVFSLAVVAARQGLDYAEASDSLAPLVAAYTIGASTEARRRLLWIAGLVIGGLAGFNLLGALARAEPKLLAAAVANTVVFGTAFLLGDNVRRRRQRVAELQEQTAHLQHTRDLETEQAVTAERQRIARELHDIVAHSVSVMAVQAGGARRVIGQRPDLAAEALATIEATARETLDELRSMLGVLRTDSAATTAPQPGLANVEQLVRSNADLDIAYRVQGDPQSLPTLVDLCAYRVIQEALTNVRKHAGPAKTNVVVDYAARPADDPSVAAVVVVSVIDNGRGAAANPGGTPGHGLAGMRERVALCHGRLESGPRSGGGWSVRAILPVTGTA